MLIKLQINLDTLDAECEDSTITVNEIGVVEGKLILELSKPDPETTTSNIITMVGL